MLWNGEAEPGAFFNALESGATILPQVVTQFDGLAFDFKRGRTGKARRKNLGDATWALWEDEAVTFTDEDDDKSNEDEDLTPGPEGRIWTTDEPGIALSPGHLAQTDFVVREITFTEFVILNLKSSGGESSAKIPDDFNWHSVMNGKRIMFGGIQQYERDLSRTNVIAPGQITIGNQPSQ